jgi:hypothetical protein
MFVAIGKRLRNIGMVCNIFTVVIEQGHWPEFFFSRTIFEESLYDAGLITGNSVKQKTF